MMNPSWTSAGFLKSSQWIFSDIFNALASDQLLLSIVDAINIWGLTIGGLCLMVGFSTRFVSFLCAGLLFMYYLASPPLVGIEYSSPSEGSYMLVNKTLIEAVALIVIGTISTDWELDRLVDRISSKFSKKQDAAFSQIKNEGY